LTEGVDALPFADCFSGISSDRTGAVVPLLELPGPYVPLIYFASAGILILATNDAGIRLDGEHGAANNAR
jgi:hypothetical protein